MSDNPNLRPSLKKQSLQVQAQTRDCDMQRHVTFATPKAIISKHSTVKRQQHHQLQHQHQKNPLKIRQPKTVADAHRKRIPSMDMEEIRIKKNKHNEQIVRLCEAQDALVQSEYVIKRMGKVAEEKEKAATELLVEAVSLMETDVQRSYQQHEIVNLLDEAEQQQENRTRNLYKELDELCSAVSAIEKVLAGVKAYNEKLDMELEEQSIAEGEKCLTIAEETKLLNDDINLYLSVLDSLKQFQM